MNLGRSSGREITQTTIYRTRVMQVKYGTCYLYNYSFLMISFHQPLQAASNRGPRGLFRDLFSKIRPTSSAGQSPNHAPITSNSTARDHSSNHPSSVGVILTFVCDDRCYRTPYHLPLRLPINILSSITIQARFRYGVVWAFLSSSY
jgi:hypothetical protein